eukprot:NODE_184_length_15718_cov_0.161342.p3 type:complete len:311 gc:universal NODE_184_length_15718_cov_0.161342:1863-931(-)
MFASKQFIRKSSSFVKIVEVGPRDGLQNESKIMSIEQRVDLVNRLSRAGLSSIEVGSFTKLPQMGNTGQVLDKIERKKSTSYSVLVPNMKGCELAISHKANEIAVFTAASESFTLKNINCTISSSLDRFKPVIQAAKAANIPVRGYVSCVVQCPYEGKIQTSSVANVTQQLIEMGCYEVSLGDTIGVASPGEIRFMLKAVKSVVDSKKLAIHCHDTYGQALANILAALDLGISVVDSSVAGLGGCPYAAGATGNVATEDVLYMLHGLGCSTGISLDKIYETGKWINNHLNRSNTSKYTLATIAKQSQAQQ